MSKNIVILFDGTGNTFTPSNLTNVFKLAELANLPGQEVYYDPGVGTINLFGLSVRNLVWYFLGLMFGWGIARNVIRVYAYLMNVYEPGDKVYIFGFSRGAYTARALCGMLHKCGLLDKYDNALLDVVQDIYYKENNEQAAKQFKEAMTRECIPHFLGLWDTVSARGILTREILPMDTELHPDIKYAYHALAIDEQRKKFEPLLLNDPPDNIEQVVEQVWFIGCHCDIGGYFEDSGLSDITLNWMVMNAKHAGLQVRNWHLLKRIDANAKMHPSRTGFWRLWRPVKRDIEPNSKIHYTAFDRVDYCPSNLPSEYTVIR